MNLQVEGVEGKPRRILVGSLSAHIPGDWRYGDDLTVSLNEEGQVVIEVAVTGAVGGMDTFNGATDPRVAHRAVLAADSTPAQVVAAVKRAMTAEPEFVLKRYGKPSKNFRWGSRPLRGLNAALAKEALAEARDELADRRRAEAPRKESELPPIFLETVARVSSAGEAEQVAGELLVASELVTVKREEGGWRVTAYRSFAPGLPGVVVSGAHVRELMAVRS